MKVKMLLFERLETVCQDVNHCTTIRKLEITSGCKHCQDEDNW